MNLYPFHRQTETNSPRTLLRLYGQTRRFFSNRTVDFRPLAGWRREGSEVGEEEEEEKCNRVPINYTYGYLGSLSSFEFEPH